MYLNVYFPKIVFRENPGHGNETQRHSQNKVEEVIARIDGRDADADRDHDELHPVGRGAKRTISVESAEEASEHGNHDRENPAGR